ncbi:hypothetical protein Tco_0192479, partial [Tanacetum coccineum]
QEEEEIDLEDILQIQDVILREKLLNISRLVTNIESLKDNPIPNHVFKSPSSFPIPITDSDSFFEKSDTSLSYSDNSLLEFEPFSDDHTDSDFSPSDDSLGVAVPILLSLTRFLCRDTFSISFIRNPLCPVIETFLPFSSENEDHIFNPVILSSNLLSHLGKITSDFSESPMMISRGDIPILDVPFIHFYPP